MKKRNGFRLISPYLLVILSFVVIIGIGSFLLVTPLAQTNGQWGKYIDSLLTATSGSCVTGLCSLENGIGQTYNIFGQIVMALLIQIGGLGFITVLTFFITLFTGKLQFKDRYFISQAVGSTNIADVVKFIRKVYLISITFELIGFLLGLPVFLTIYKDNVGYGIWASLFTSISAFNNAGFDLFGASSLIRDASNPIVMGMPNWCYYYLCTYLMVLIIFGGISFLVIMDIFVFKKGKTWRTFTKVVLMMTGILIVFGFIAFLLSDVTKSVNPMSPFDAIFQSVSLRTAGFATYNQNDISTAGKAISCLLMYIGGAPLSTAGGIKVTTIYIIFLSIISFFRGVRPHSFKRTYSYRMILKAMSLVVISIIIIIISFLSISAMESGNSFTSEQIVYEVFSAFGTVGVTCGITTSLSVGSKIIICILMFIGRLGPITFFNIFEDSMTKDASKHYEYIEEDLLIG